VEASEQQVGYRKNEGFTKYISERYTARANSSFKITPNFTIGENTLIETEQKQAN
jgi:hypothetical protein